MRTAKCPEVIHEEVNVRDGTQMSETIYTICNERFFEAIDADGDVALGNWWRSL